MYQQSTMVTNNERNNINLVSTLACEICSILTPMYAAKVLRANRQKQRENEIQKFKKFHLESILQNDDLTSIWQKTIPPESKFRLIWDG